MPAKARSARGRRHNASRLDKCFQKPLLQRLEVNALRGGDDDAPHAVCNLLAAHHFGGDAHIRDAAVRAGAYHHLVNLDLARFAHGPHVGRQMRKRDDRFERGEINHHGALVFGIGIGREDSRRSDGRSKLRPSRLVRIDVGEGLFIDGEDAVFRAGFDGHVGDGEAVVHRKVRHAVARKLQRHVSRTVDADLADQMEDYVLSAHPLPWLAAQLDLDRGGHAQPGLSAGHARGHVGGADARRERAERAVRAGVRIRADHEVAGRDEPLLRQKRVLDSAVVAHLEVVDDPLLLRERPHRGALLRGLDILVRREVVGHERDLLPVDHLGASELGELADGHGRGDVVSENKVQLRHDQLAGVERRRARGARPTSGVR